MGSAHVAVADDHLHVGVDPDGHWWAVGKEGSYGGSRQRSEAVQVAIDASRTGSQGTRRVIVHNHRGAVEFQILRCRGKGSPQFFQD